MLLVSPACKREPNGTVAKAAASGRRPFLAPSRAGSWPSERRRQSNFHPNSSTLLMHPWPALPGRLCRHICVTQRSLSRSATATFMQQTCLCATTMPRLCCLTGLRLGPGNRLPIWPKHSFLTCPRQSSRSTGDNMKSSSPIIFTSMTTLFQSNTRAHILGDADCPWRAC